MTGQDPAPLVRSRSLDCTPAAAGQARAFVRGVLAETGRQRWCDTAELAVSELVTNAVLHARTLIVVTVEAGPDGARITVGDLCPALPSARAWGHDATTGRGLGLVSRLCAAHGVLRSGEGKQIWFVVDDSSEGGDDALAGFGEWDLDALLGADDDGVPGARPDGGAVLLGVPLVLWSAAQQQYEALLREMFLRESGPSAEGMDLAGAFAALSSLAQAVAGAAPSGRGGQADATVAAESGGASFSALQDVLDASHRLASAGMLLGRPSLPEVVALRDWACEQVVAQSFGVPATPWSSTDHPRFVADDAGPAGPAWDDTSVRGSARAEVAVDDTNRIVAVSGPAAGLLGWDADALVGQRVVRIVPPEMREAHVAGFTRHLTTGQAHALDVPVDLPVLRADGTLVTCRLLISRVPAAAGRAVYVAVLEPLGPAGTPPDA